jgi:hypothetical protein
MNIRKIFISSLFILIGIVVVSVLWKNTLTLSVLLLVIAYVKNQIIPIKKAAVFFIIGGLLGTFGESVIMLSGPWSYSFRSIINFPLWLPFLWGLVATIGISIYEGIS